MNSEEVDAAVVAYSPSDDVPRMKMVLVGDVNVASSSPCIFTSSSHLFQFQDASLTKITFYKGKTFLLIRYANSYPHNGYYNVKADHNGKPNNLLLFEMKLGQETESLTPPLSFSQVDIFIICFSLVAPGSLLAASKWWNALSTSRVPFILVGTKSELRDIIPKGIPHVETEQGQMFAKKIGAADYIECSATAQTNVSLVFERAMHVVTERYAKKLRKKEKSCSLM